MYTGTLINELMAAVERVEEAVLRRYENAEEKEVRLLEEMYAPAALNEPDLVGAA